MSFVSGILAALAAPLLMTVGFIMWDNQWTGSPFSMNLYKCNVATIGFVIVSVASRLLQDGVQPFSSTVFRLTNVGYLMLSSAIGIIIGDLMWLEALRLLGARRVIVMDSLKPFLAAVFGWAFLEEELRWGAVGGIVLTVVGILLVKSEEENLQQQQQQQQQQDKENDNEHGNQQQSSGNDIAQIDALTTTGLEEGDNNINDSNNNNRRKEDVSSPSVKNTNTNNNRPSLNHTNSSKRAQNSKQLQWGYTMSILNVIFDTYGSVLTKQYGADFTTWEINFVRFGFAGIIMAICSLVLTMRDRISVTISSSTTTNKENVDEKENKPHQPPNKIATDAIEEDASIEVTPLWYQLPISTMSKSAWIHVSFGVIFVTFLTPALSNYALFQIALALALTLGSVGPLYALPSTFVMQKHEHTTKKQPFSLKACIGAILAVAGIVILAFWGTLE